MAQTATQAPFGAALNERLKGQIPDALNRALATDPRYQPTGAQVAGRPPIIYKNG